MPRIFGFLFALTLLLPGATRAADLPGAWVQYVADGGVEARAITMPGAPCPPVVADGSPVASHPRGGPDAAYPIQVCAAHLPATAIHVTVGSLPAPVPPPRVKRVVVIGDTGCRLKGKYIQDCNDPASWPFATVARLAAARRPDLVIHVGDFHYRETPCPADHPGCAGSPYGDNWEVWRRDFFDPAAPLLAVAPWVMVRGNHELCDRGGLGWTRLIAPHADATTCASTSDPYAVNVDSLHLLVLDSAAAPDPTADPALVGVYRQQLHTLLDKAPAHSWLLSHRPVWAEAEGAGVPANAMLNATLQSAIGGLVPPNLDMVLSGHIHDFMSYEFGPQRPAQLVIGEGGDANDEIVQPVAAGLEIDGMRVRRAFAFPDYGYVVLNRTQPGWAATVYSVADQVLARCTLHGRALSCHPVVH